MSAWWTATLHVHMPLLLAAIVCAAVLAALADHTLDRHRALSRSTRCKHGPHPAFSPPICIIRPSSNLRQHRRIAQAGSPDLVAASTAAADGRPSPPPAAQSALLSHGPGAAGCAARCRQAGHTAAPGPHGCACGPASRWPASRRTCSTTSSSRHWQQQRRRGRRGRTAAAGGAQHGGRVGNSRWLPGSGRGPGAAVGMAGTMRGRSCALALLSVPKPVTGPGHRPPSCLYLPAGGP